VRIPDGGPHILLTRDRFIKALFDDIRANAPAILFIDEIEFLLRVPSQNSSDVVSDVQCLITALWTKLMDDGIRFVFIGTTHKPLELDYDGFGRRFEIKIYLPLPIKETRVRILRPLLAKYNINATDAELTELARLSKGLSGDDIRRDFNDIWRDRLLDATVSTYFRRVCLIPRSVIVSGSGS
jgi:SpoVK/Ycf46/Vps4 family AAA+-type ATPase